MSGNIEEPETTLSSLEQFLVEAGFAEDVAKRIVVLCSDYADKRFEKFRKARIKIERTRADDLYKMCKKLKQTKNFVESLEKIEEKLLEMCVQDE